MNFSNKSCLLLLVAFFGISNITPLNAMQSDGEGDGHEQHRPPRKRRARKEKEGQRRERAREADEEKKETGEEPEEAFAIPAKCPACQNNLPMMLVQFDGKRLPCHENNACLNGALDNLLSGKTINDFLIPDENIPDLSGL